MLKAVSTLLLLSIALASASAGDGQQALSGAAPAKSTCVKIKVSNGDNNGDIIAQLNGEQAPISVANFLKYVDEGLMPLTRF